MAIIQNPVILGTIIFVLIGWLIFLSTQLLMIRRRYRAINEAAKKGDLASLINQCVKDIDEVETQLKEAKLHQEQIWSQLQGAIQRVGIVRFDAFGDMGGKLSFAAAFLNENGNGIVVSTINGRQESRCYAKPVEEESSPYALSQEEKEAIARAMTKSKSKPGRRLGGDYEEI